tara:strand:+ start:1033 stop:1434 length:402 start_codon:yes stop_codon:yes gene_type:complete
MEEEIYTSYEDYEKKMNDRTDEEWSEQIDYSVKKFDHAKFVCYIFKDTLQFDFSKEKMVVIKQTFNCSCFNNDNRPQNKYFVINNNNNLTLEEVIEELIKQGFEAGCDHYFLDDIEQETDVQYRAVFINMDEE